jgi:hypothetical protein
LSSGANLTANGFPKSSTSAAYIFQKTYQPSYPAFISKSDALSFSEIITALIPLNQQRVFKDAPAAAHGNHAFFIRTVRF